MKNVQVNAEDSLSSIQKHYIGQKRTNETQSRRKGKTRADHILIHQESTKQQRKSAQAEAVFCDCQGG